jgi:hypothetical protein
LWPFAAALRDLLAIVNAPLFRLGDLFDAA